MNEEEKLYTFYSLCLVVIESIFVLIVLVILPELIESKIGKAISIAVIMTLNELFIVSYYKISKYKN